MEDTYTRCVVCCWTDLGDLIIVLLRENGYGTVIHYFAYHYKGRCDKA